MTRERLDEPAAAGCADLLRERTGAVHREAERSGFIADLIRGRATCAGYAVYLRNLVPAYAALERRLAAQMSTPLVAPFADTRLRRLGALEADLARIAGDGWRDRPALEAASAYAAAIEAAAATPARLVAHAYARYLGDLSGGQILKSLLARTLKLEAAALSFYDFSDLGDLDAAKARMREAIDTIPIGGAEATALVDEAISAFRHNIALSIAVSEAVQAAV